VRDRRLLGVWKSDARRTPRELRARRDIPATTRRVFEPLFGKVEYRFTAARCWTTLDGHTWSEPYVVVAKDDSSVATVSPDGRGVDTTTHIHFCEDAVFWVHVGSGKFREFFRRVGP
jgi:hypothetical protein